MNLVNWTYTKEEWRAYQRLLRRSQHRVVRFFARWWQRSKLVPTISITAEKVVMGREQRYFNSGRHELQQVDLRNEHSVNILSITFESQEGRQELRIPIPKGKLKEAIQVQDKLYTTCTH